MENAGHIERLIDRQKSHEDLFITKYGQDEKIRTIILDFDGKDKEKVYNEVLKIYSFLKYKKVNSVIVSSTNKGYHFYIQIPEICFDERNLMIDRAERNKLFVMFTKNFINYEYFNFSSLNIETLDETNTHAGLGGNIRLLGSIHPKTGERVHIVKGEFINVCDDKLKEEYYEKCSYYVKSIYKITRKEYSVKKEIDEKKILENKKKWLKKNGKWDYDPIMENDLRELIPRLYGGTVRKYGDYIFMQCPWHADRNPSLKVKKEWFYCTGCGAKGNIWTLIKNGELKKGGL